MRTLIDTAQFLESPRWREGRLWLSDALAGTVLTVSLDGATSIAVRIEGIPSGLAIAPDGRLIVASMVRRQLLELLPGSERIDASGASRTVIPLDFHPDNLSWRADGALLVAGQRGSLPELLACGQVVRGACRVSSVVALLDPETLRTSVVLEDDPPTRIGAASVAQQVGGSLWIGSFASDRIVELRANLTQR